MGRKDKPISSEDEQSIGAQLRAARYAKKISLTEMAKRLNVSKGHLSGVENGSVRPSQWVLEKCEKVLGLEEGQLSQSLESLGLIPSHSSRIEQIPIASNPYFTGREHLLTLLHERFSTERKTALTQAQALCGLGGIGKTQTAAEYAYRYGHDYTYVFWIFAVNRETLVAGFVKLAELLDLSEKEDEQSRIVDVMKRWLATHGGWLLIMDNADDLLLAKEFLPAIHKGSILYTTRAQAAGVIAASIEVEQLNLQESTVLLLRWAHLLDDDGSLDQVRGEDRVAAERIVETMGGLPLAIVQAGAYMEETGCTLVDYLDLYMTHHKDLLARRSDLVLDYPDSVATTWAVSFALVEQQNPAAANVLRLCAFLAADAIPEELLTRGAAALGELPGAGMRDPYQLNEALEVLRRYSLVRRDGSSHTLSIHPLVQTVLKDSLDQETQRTWAERTVRVVSAAFPETDQGKGVNRQAYLPHVQECAALIEQHHLYFPEAGRLLFQAGAFLYYHGFHPQSESLHRQALAIREESLGLEHPDVAESLNALAILARLQNNYEEAERFHQQALAIREQSLGLEHPAVVESINNLGVLYRNQSKFEQAKVFLQRALSIREKVLGSEHPDTLITLINVGKLDLEQHRYEQAKQLLEQALATGKRILKPGDPLVAYNLNLLARLYFEQGNYEQAEMLRTQSLALLEKELGPEHPATAELLNDLAELYFAQGRYPEAQSLCQRALDVCEKRLGLEHPDTIAYREFLARIVSKIEVK